MTRRVSLSLVTLVALLIASPPVSAQIPDWSALADTDVIEILTHDEDEELRETTVWLVVVDGLGYVRTGDTRWRANIARDANVVIRVADQSYPLRAELATDAALRARGHALFREKYGVFDRVTGWFGNDGGTYFFALLPRPASP